MTLILSHTEEEYVLSSECLLICWFASVQDDSKSYLAHLDQIVRTNSPSVWDKVFDPEGPLGSHF